MGYVRGGLSLVYSIDRNHSFQNHEKGYVKVEACGKMRVRLNTQQKAAIMRTEPTPPVLSLID